MIGVCCVDRQDLGRGNRVGRSPACGPTDGREFWIGGPTRAQTLIVEREILVVGWRESRARSGRLFRIEAAGEDEQWQRDEAVWGED